MSGYNVSLHASFVDRGPPWKLLGSGKSDAAGAFEIAYALPAGLPGEPSMLFAQAERGPALLASAIGIGSNPPANIVVNERTTVAVGTAFAQFVDDRRIRGNTYGMLNALPMAANLADSTTGAVGVVLATTPNGIWISTLRTFNSLANAVAGCVADARNCARLFRRSHAAGRTDTKGSLIEVKHNSVSAFRPDGSAITQGGGYTQANLSWPMATVADPTGNIWITNCGNDTVTMFPAGDANRAINIPLGPTPHERDPQIKPVRRRARSERQSLGQRQS